MKRKELLKLIIGIALVAVLAISIPLMSGCRPAAAPVAPPEVAEELPIYKWRYQDTWLAPQTAEFTRYMADLIEEGSGGRVSITVHSIDELVPMEQLFQAVEDGTIEIAMINQGYCGVPIDIAPLDNAPAFLWTSATEAVTLFEGKGLEEIFAETYESVGAVHYLGMVTMDQPALLTSMPVTKYEDFAGLRIYGPPELTHPFTEAGAISMVMSVEEAMLGFQTGVLDGLYTLSATEAGNFGLHELLPYYLYPPFAVWIGHVCINAELWDSLPSDLQTIIEMSVEAEAKKVLAYYEVREPHWRPQFEISILSDEDLARLKAAEFEYYEELAQTVPKAAEILRIVREYQAEREAALMD